jgi:hypothetical protein
MTLRPLILSVTLCASSLAGCSTPAALVKPTTVAAAPAKTTACPTHQHNPSGRTILYDFALFTCRGTTQADCTRTPVWERACNASDAEAQLHLKQYCLVPSGATSFLLVYNQETRLAEAAAGYYAPGDPVAPVCGTSLPQE